MEKRQRRLLFSVSSSLSSASPFLFSRHRSPQSHGWSVATE
nr:hypothetical protein [Geobacillus sp. PK12]